MQLINVCYYSYNQNPKYFAQSLELCLDTIIPTGIHHTIICLIEKRGAIDGTLANFLVVMLEDTRTCKLVGDELILLWTN